MTTPWFVHSLIAVTALGVMMALFKVPTARGHNKYVYSFLSLLVAALLSLAFFGSSITTQPKVIMFGALWGGGYALLVMLQMNSMNNSGSSM